MKNLHLYLSLLFILTCAKEDSQAPDTTPSNITPRYTLTASTGEGGSVSPTTGSFNAGTQVSVTATPSAGYTFSGWSNGSSDNPVTVTLNSNTNITANFALIPVYTITVSAEDGGSVSSNGGEYQQGAQVTLTATPDEGYEFSGWSDGNTEATRVITASEDLTITATFTELVYSYQLTVTSTEGGSISSEGGEYNEGTEVTITATPDEGYRFIEWSDGSTEESTTITLSEDTTLEALFELIPVYTLTVTSTEGGSISSEGGDYQEGAELTITATPDEGYRFIGWSDSSTEESITITLSEDTTLEALFELIPVYTVTVTSTNGGSISTGGGDYEEGTEVTLTATASKGYVFNGWEDGVNQNPRSITIDSDKSINASFISIFDYFNILTNNVLNISISNINKTTGNYNNWYRPFIDYNKLIDRRFYSFVYVLENGDVGLAPYPEDKHHGHEQLWHNFLDINNNEIPDMVFTGTTIRSEKHGEVYVVIDNELKYRFNSGQAGSRKILIGDLDNNGSDDAVLIATGIDRQPYSGSPTKIIYFTPNSYEYVNLDDDPSYFHTGSIGDINNDGNLDLIIANNQGPEDTFTYIGDGNKNFSKIKVGEVKDFAQKTATEFFDLNNDGILDLISGGWETPTIGSDGNIIEDWRNRTELSYGNGDGTFDIENSIQFPEIDYWGKVNAFIFHDIDNDGDTEIIINRTKGHEDYPSVDNDNSYDGIKIQILKKQGNEYVNHQIIDGPEGWFDLPPTWIEWIPWIKLFDVNSDGIMDIVPDHENINDPNFNQLNRYWGLYYKGNSSGLFEIDFFDPNMINN